VGSSEAVATVSSWVGAAGRTSEFEAAARRLLHVAARQPGHRDGTVLHEPGSNEFHLVQTFGDGAALERWQRSSERRAALDDLERYGTRTLQPQRITGLEGWFLAANGNERQTLKPPPRWKMLLTSFAGAYPLVLLFNVTLEDALEDVPLVLRAAILPAVLLTLMTYVVMPRLTQLLRPWLS